MNWYIVITDDMRSMGLKGNDLMVYAVIAGFSQNDQGCFYGTQHYLAELCGINERTARNVLAKLEADKVIEKSEYYENGIRRCSYKAIKGVPEKNSGVPENFSETPEKNSGTHILNQDKEDKCINKYNTHTLSLITEYGCSEQSIDDWLAARKQRRAPEVNQSVINCLLREAGAANIPVSRAVEVAAEYGWQNFTAKWYLERVATTTSAPARRRGPRSVYERNLEQMRRGGLIDDKGKLI